MVTCVSARRLYRSAMSLQMAHITPLPAEVWWAHIFSSLQGWTVPGIDPVDNAIRYLPMQKKYFQHLLPSIALPLVEDSDTFDPYTKLLIDPFPKSSDAPSTAHPKDKIPLRFSKHRGKTHLTLFEKNQGFCNWAMDRKTSAGYALKGFITYVLEKRELIKESQKKDLLDAVQKAILAMDQLISAGLAKRKRVSVEKSSDPTTSAHDNDDFYLEIRCPACIVANGGCGRCLKWECDACIENPTLWSDEEEFANTKMKCPPLHLTNCMDCNERVCCNCYERCGGGEGGETQRCNKVLCTTTNKFDMSPNDRPTLCSWQGFQECICEECHQTIEGVGREDSGAGAPTYFVEAVTKTNVLVERMRCPLIEGISMSMMNLVTIDLSTAMIPFIIYISDHYRLKS